MRCLIPALALFAACNDGGDPFDDPPCGRTGAAGLVPCTPDPGDPIVTVAWSFFPMVMGSELLGTCRAGVSAVEVHTSLGTMISQPCGANRSAEIEVPFNERILVRLVDETGATVAESPPEAPQGRVQVRATFYEDGGYARVQWNVHSAQPGTPPPQRCFDAMPLRLTVTDETNTQVLSTFYPCPQLGKFQILTSGIREGTYTFTFTGLGGTKSVMAPIGRNNAVTDLEVTTP